MREHAAPYGSPTPGAREPGSGEAVLAQLHDLEQRGASGEFVCSCSTAEVHVYMQGGRIAWARDSLHRRAFTEHLKEHAGLDQASVEEVLAECRRTRRPLGETLVSWKLATRDQVRAAIRHQMVQALNMVEDADPCRALFLERAEDKQYDPQLTFQLSELVSADRPGQPMPDEEARARSRDTDLPSRGGEPEPRPAAGALWGADPGEPGEVIHMTAIEKLKELQGIDGFLGAALFTPTGERLVALEGDAQRLTEVGILANNVLLNSQKASLEMGAGRGQQVHVEGEKAHIIVRCLNEGTDPVKSQPGRAHIHLVLVLKNDGSIGLAKMRMNTAVQKLAEEFR